nr:hypothetical protein [Tanacetum cinerariifolium]
YSIKDTNPWFNFFSFKGSRIFIICLFGFIWNFALSDGDLVIFDEDEAVDGDLIYVVELYDILGLLASAEYSIKDTNPWFNFFSSKGSRFFIICLFGFIWNFALSDGDLVIFDEDEAVDGDLIYVVELYDILGLLASAE